jgi:serine/threonine protein kinase/formylglycine-generating enzyme required for sulfatase activity/tetratricopeptide (TPR) repeat protein
MAQPQDFPPTSRDNLLGLLAVRNNLLTPEALDDALRERQRDSAGRPLGQVLVDRGLLAARERQALEALVDGQLERHGNAGKTQGSAVAGSGALPSESPVLATLSVAHLPANSSAQNTQELSSGTPNGAWPAGMPAAQHGGPDCGSERYQILRPHARGGLGEVFVAHDTELHREVALKEIHAHHADHAESRQRFLIEAEITGNLEHPGVVPVYGLGCHADGRPFYAMRFIRGESLKEALQRFHAAAPQGAKADLARRALELRQLLRRFIDVCNAVAYAHSKGVIHRDLKPDNVMLGEFGETLVVDWGLAKVLGSKEETRAASVTLRLSGSGQDSSFTHAGDVLGTPGYMSPEQAEGKLDELGSASDVYSLGATLYAVLTGKAPFEGTDVHEVLAQVRRGEFPPPRRVRSSVPAALEAVCQKAMALLPQDRYASARDLADDVDRWLADAPVAAYPEPLRVRLARWRRRHPALVTGTVALVFTGLVAVGVGGLLLSREQGRTLEEQRGKLSEERKAREALEGRATAQVEALLSANPQAVPAILDSLRPYREQIRPRLRELLQQQPGPASPAEARRWQQQRRTRAALALLPEDPGQAAFLSRRLLTEDVQPEEMLLIRDRLARTAEAHGAALTAKLWDEASRRDAPAGRRFRALVALAEFDPASPRWKEASRDVVGPLVSADPIHVGVWSSGLRGVRDALLGPLGEAFREKTRPAERRVAASVLVDYTSDRPKMLADLLLDASAEQFVALLPGVKGRRHEILPVLEGELGRKPWPRWPDPPAGAKNWQRPEAAVVEEVEKAQGLVGDHFALCQALPLERFAAVAEALRPAGYRPTRFRPYAPHGHGGLRVAALWDRDGRDWQLAQGLKAEQVLEKDREWRKKDYLPADAAGWLLPEAGGGPVYVYGALWVKRSARDEEGWLSVGVPAGRLKEAYAEPKAKHFAPLALQRFTAADDEVTYSTVWHKGGTAPANWALNWGGSEQYYRALLGDLSFAPVDIHLDRVAGVGFVRMSVAGSLAQTEKAVRDKPKDSNALYHRGQAYLRAGQNDKALADLDAVVKQFPRFANGYRDRAVVRARLGRDAEARADLTRFEELGTDSSQKLHTRALVEAYVGDEKAVVRQLEQAAADRGKDGLFLYNLACSFAQLSRASAERGRVQAAVSVVAFWGLPASWAREELPRHLDGLARETEKRTEARAARAVSLLRRAVEAGYDDFSLMATDVDLEPLWVRTDYAALLRQGRLEQRYTSVRYPRDAHDWVELHGLDLAQHRERCREVAAQGYRPVALSVAEGRNGEPAVAASSWRRPAATPEQRTALAQRQANAAVALLHLGRSEPVWPLFRHSEHPDLRTYLIHRAALLGAAARLLFGRLAAEQDTSARRVLLLALGEYDPGRLPAAERKEWSGQLLRWFREDADPGIHGAVDWLLRVRWGMAEEVGRVEAELAGQTASRRGWQVNKERQTFTRVDGPVEILMGSPPNEPGRHSSETQHRRRIPRSYAIATKKVTVEQFQRFLADVQRKYPGAIRHSYTKKYSPDPKGPIIGISWYDAAMYCRWLSEQEGVPEDQMCYPPIPQIRAGVRLPSDYLSRTGYRLPTEAEWESACRAGAASSRFYGESDELLGRYAWYVKNSDNHAWPVGWLKPNDLGLFDMLGNAFERCQAINTRPSAGGRPIVDAEVLLAAPQATGYGVLRGGPYSYIADPQRCASHHSNLASARPNTDGFRLARTTAEPRPDLEP